MWSALVSLRAAHPQTGQDRGEAGPLLGWPRPAGGLALTSLSERSRFVNERPHGNCSHSAYQLRERGRVRLPTQELETPPGGRVVGLSGAVPERRGRGRAVSRDVTRRASAARAAAILTVQFRGSTNTVPRGRTGRENHVDNATPNLLTSRNHLYSTPALETGGLGPQPQLGPGAACCSPLWSVVGEGPLSRCPGGPQSL